MNKIEILEYEVNTCVCNWDEIKITHKNINKKFIKQLISDFKKLPFVYDSYKAENGLIRLNMIGNENRKNPFLNRDVPADICINVNKGYCTIMRNGSQEYLIKENQVISLIVYHCLK